MIVPVTPGTTKRLWTRSWSTFCYMLVVNTNRIITSATILSKICTTEFWAVVLGVSVDFRCCCSASLRFRIMPSNFFDNLAIHFVQYTIYKVRISGAAAGVQRSTEYTIDICRRALLKIHQPPRGSKRKIGIGIGSAGGQAVRA